MQYCINALLKNNNEIMQYCIINNDIALIMHYRALLQMPDYNDHQAKNSLQRKKIIGKKILGKEKLQGKIFLGIQNFFFGKFCIQNGQHLWDFYI